MPRYAHEKPNYQHPLVATFQNDMLNKKISKREFLRRATLLGVSATAAYILADIPMPLADDHNTPKSGGILRCTMPVFEAKDPATFAWVMPSNILRHQNEYLTITGSDDLTRPMLAESWSASDDLLIWTFKLRENVKWHNSDVFNADDVIFNFVRWADPDIASSNIGLFSAMLIETEDGPRLPPSAIEKVDDYTVRIHLQTPLLSMPENLYNYPTMIVHRSFSGDLTKDANGTGPYQVVEHSVGEKAILKRVADHEYWGKDISYIGAGYLDEIHYIDFGSDSAAQIDAIANDQADMTYELNSDNMQDADNVANAETYVTDTAQTGIMRMRVDQAPFDQLIFRQALQLCCDASVYPDLLFNGEGRAAEHHHVAPTHPEYYRLPKLKRDIPRAMNLLNQAGYPDGVDLTLVCGNTSGNWQQKACEIFKEQAADAGFRITIKLVSSDEYWQIWDKTPFGITQWQHRPLGTMALSLGYRSGVPWNETGYASNEFDRALTKAEAILDVTERAEAMEDVEGILQTDAVMIQPVWLPVFFLASNKLQGIRTNPAMYHQFNGIWIDES